MQVGLHSVNLHTCGYPDTMARLARAAEAAGFESLWVADHVVLPDPPMPQCPMAPNMRLLDPIVALTSVAAHTTRIRLGTGVIVLPQRNPLVLAKQQDIEALRETEQRYQRPSALGRLEISVTPPSYDVEPEMVERYVAIGVDRLILRPQPTLDGAGLEQFVARTAQTLGIQQG